MKALEAKFPNKIDANIINAIGKIIKKIGLYNRIEILFQFALES